MKASELIARLTVLVCNNEDMDVLIDTGMHLREIEEVDLDASDEGIVIWAGFAVES